MVIRTASATRYGALDPRPNDQNGNGSFDGDEKKYDDNHHGSNGKHSVNDEDRVFVPRNHLDPGTTDRTRTLWAISVCLLVAFIVVAFVLWGRHNNDDVSEARREFKADVYNYIVVGGGPSGILVSVKLAQKLKHAKVLLLESGTASQAAVLKSLRRPGGNGGLNGREHEFWNMFDIPLMWSGVASSQGRLMSIQGGDFSVVSPNSWSSHHWPIPLTLLGRGLGGSGLHNAMIYVRSLPSDFERWNLTGWTWDHILPLYRGMETFIDTAWDDILATLLKRGGSNSSDRPKYSWRGNAGPVVTVPSGPRVDAVAPLFVESAIANGIPRAANGFNHPDSAKRIGAGFYEFNIRNGIRGSIAEAFLGERSKHPPNLEIRTGVTVTRVLMHSLNRAAGVEYVDGEEGAIHRFMLNTSDQNAEVILASGAIMTPQLLANSGIGENGTVADLPGVGKNLQDHPVVAMTFSISPELAEAATSIYTVADEMEDYFVAVAELERNRLLFGANNASALLSLERITSRLGTISTAGFSAGAFLKSPWADTANDKAAPDIQLTVFPRVIEPHVTSHQKNEDKTVTRSSAMLVTIALLQPEGRYQVYPANYEAAALFWDSIPPISSPVMPLTDNVLYPLPTIKLPVNCTEYLTDRDVLRLAWGVEQVRSILSTPPLSTKTGHELYPGSHITGTLLNDHVRQHNLPNSHWVGSTKMGADHDPLAVVDEKLRVRGGVTGLRIVDSGVFPYAPNGNTHSTVCVVASRAADMIVQGRSEEDT